MAGIGSTRIFDPGAYSVCCQPARGPVCSGISPASGTELGGTAVTITGSGFTGATGVLFDGVPATSVVVVDDSHITCVTPAGSWAAAGDVTVQGATGTCTLAGAFTYEFTPLSGYVTWYAAYWADDPDWADPGVGNAVSSWRDGSGNGRTLTQGTPANQPTLLQSALGNLRRVVDFDGSADILSCAEATFGNLAQPYSVLTVVNDAFNVNWTIWSSDTATSGKNALMRYQTLANWQLYAGTSLTYAYDGTAPLPKFYGGKVNGGASAIWRDGVQLATGNSGVSTLGGFRLGATYTPNSYLNGGISFAGVYAGDLFVDAGYADLIAGLVDFYGYGG